MGPSMRNSDTIIFRILEFVRRHSLAVIAVTALITALCGVSLLKLRVDPDVESLLSELEKVTGAARGPAGDEVTQNFFVLAAEAADPFTLDGLAALSQALDALAELPQMKPGITPFNLVGFTRVGTRLGLQPLSRGGRAPASAAELEAFKRNLLDTPSARNFVISQDGTTLVAFFPVEKADNYTRLMDRIEGLIAPLKPYYRTHVTGSLPFMKTTESYLSKDLSRLLLLAALVTLVTFYLGFRAIRSALLPLLIVLMGTLWCLGFMSLLGYPLSIMSVVIPPLVLALGSSYSIHVLNQYYRESPEGGQDKGWITAAVAHINRTIFLAAVTTIAGLLSLLVVSMKQGRQFALATSVGIAACALLSLFFFPAVLYRLKAPPARHRRQVREGALARAIGGLGGLASRGRYVIVGLLVALVALFAFSARNIRYNTDAMTYFPEREQVVQDMRFFTAKVGGFEEVNLTLTAPGGQKGYFLDLDNLALVSRFEDRLRAIPDVCYLTSFLQYVKEFNRAMHGSYALPDSRAPVLLLARYFRALGSQDQGAGGLASLASQDFSAITVKLRIYDSARASFIDEVGLRQLLGKIDAIQAAELPPQVAVTRWGRILRYLSLSDILQRDSLRSNLVAIAAILCITTIAFRSFRFGLLSLVPLLTGIILNGLFLVATGIPLDMITIMVSSIAMGVGVDNSIHFLIQFRRQAAETRGDLDTVLRRTMEVAGRPIVLTTASIIAGLLILTLGIFRPIVHFGLLVAFTLLAATLGAVVVLPAVMSVALKRGWGGKAPG
jgi:predicted RND superfamily exporter protein